MRNKTVIPFLLVILALLCGVFFLYKRHTESGMLNFECYSEFTFLLGDNESLPRENAMLRYHVKPDGTGLYNLDGMFDNGVEKYRVARTVHFTYQPYGNDSYHVAITDIEIHPRENVPPALYSHYLDDKVGSSRVSKISPVGRDAYILGTATMPMIVCTRYR